MTQRDLFRHSAALEPRTHHRAQAAIQSRARLAIRQQLKVAGRVRDLALFDCDIDAKLRGCDLVKLRVSDVAPAGQFVSERRSSSRRRAGLCRSRSPTPRVTRPLGLAEAAWAARGRLAFPSRTRVSEHMSTRHYARLVQEWLALIDLELKAYDTHSLRRTKVAMLYKKTGNLRACQLLLGHRKLESTVRYLGIEVDDALAMSEQVDL